MNLLFFIPKIFAAASGPPGSGGSSSELLGPIGGGGLGPFGDLGNTIGLGKGAGGGATALAKVTGAISMIIGVMTIAASVWFLLQILIAGIAWITSAGDKGKLGEARDRITNAFIGLVIVVAGWAILAIAGIFFGYDIVISSPTQLINFLKL
jgi:hypothetical protein